MAWSPMYSLSLLSGQCGVSKTKAVVDECKTNKNIRNRRRSTPHDRPHQPTASVQGNDRSQQCNNPMKNGENQKSLQCCSGALRLSQSQLQQEERERELRRRRKKKILCSCMSQFSSQSTNSMVFLNHPLLKTLSE